MLPVVNNPLIYREGEQSLVTRVHEAPTLNKKVEVVASAIVSKPFPLPDENTYVGYFLTSPFAVIDRQATAIAKKVTNVVYSPKIGYGPAFVAGALTRGLVATLGLVIETLPLYGLNLLMAILMLGRAIKDRIQGE